MVGGGGPDDFEAGEGEREEGDFGLEVGGGWGVDRRGRGRGGGGGGGAGVVGPEGVEGEGSVLVEFDEEHGGLVVLEHRLRLGEETAVFEGGDEVADRFALDANVWREDVVGDGQHAGDDLVGAAVEEGGQGGAELADVDDDAGRFGRGCEAAAARDGAC